MMGGACEIYTCACAVDNNTTLEIAIMELNTGARIPALGFGTFTWEDTQELGKLVEHAIEVS